MKRLIFIFHLQPPEQGQQPHCRTRTQRQQQLRQAEASIKLIKKPPGGHQTAPNSRYLAIVFGFAFFNQFYASYLHF